MATDIVLYDGQTTPVAHTFKPVDRAQAGGGVLFQDISSGVPDSYPSIILRGRESESNVFRAYASVEVPIMETISGTNAQGYQALAKQAFVLRARTEYTLDGRAAASARKDLMAYDKNLRSNAQFVALVLDLLRPF